MFKRFFRKLFGRINRLPFLAMFTTLGKIILATFVLILAVIFAAVVSYAEELKTPWHFNIENDVVIPGQHDRFLSNAFKIGYGNFAIGNEMYSPTDKRDTRVDTGDRPWDGYSYLEYQTLAPVAFGEEFETKYRIGAVGEVSGSEALQKFVHNDLGMGIPPTWEGQNPSEPTAEILLTKRNREYLHSVVGDSRLTQEYGARLGTVTDEVFLDQELRKHFFSWLYLYAGARAAIVGYNTHLDGRLFQDNNYTVKRIPFVASARIGFELYRAQTSDWYIDYEWKYLTEEFENQVGRHAYGSLTFGQRF